jgi:hypothetical protein
LFSKITRAAAWEGDLALVEGGRGAGAPAVADDHVEAFLTEGGRHLRLSAEQERMVRRGKSLFSRALKGRGSTCLTFRLSMRLGEARKRHGKGTEGTDPGRGGALVDALPLRRGHMRDPPVPRCRSPRCTVGTTHLSRHDPSFPCPKGREALQAHFPFIHAPWRGTQGGTERARNARTADRSVRHSARSFSRGHIRGPCPPLSESQLPW